MNHWIAMRKWIKVCHLLQEPTCVWFMLLFFFNGEGALLLLVV